MAKSREQKKLAPSLPSAKDLSANVVRQLRALNQPDINAQLEKLWGVARESSADKLAAERRLRGLVENRNLPAPNAARGRQLFGAGRGQLITRPVVQPIELGVETVRGDQVAVVSGLKSGEEVVTSGVFKLREGAAVYVNNAVRPANSPAPKPENS